MARTLLAGVVVAAALGLIGPAAAGRLDVLRSAAVAHRHVVLQLSVYELRPVEFLAARRRAVDVDGAFVQKNVRLRETIRLAPTARGVVLWTSPTALRPGVYFVQVMSLETGGVTDCPPKMLKCGEQFSNVRRVVARKSS